MYGDLYIEHETYGQAGETVTAKDVSIFAQRGGAVDIDGSVNVDSNGYGGDSSEGGTDAGDGTGGHIRIQAEQDSTVNIDGDLSVESDGFGGEPGAPGVDAGEGTGGLVFIGTVGNNASLTVGGLTYVAADGFGGDGDGSSSECFGCDGLGGVGRGGTINVGTTVGTGSTAYFGGLVELWAEGYGGTSALAASASADGFGGDIFVFSDGGAVTQGYGLTFASDLWPSPTAMAVIATTLALASRLATAKVVRSPSGPTAMRTWALTAS